jgi:hypothetical protein
MSITVEDGTVVAGANSYLSVEDADTYFEEHGSPADWTAMTTEDKEAALKYATKYLDGKMKWYSCILDRTQVLGWPRKQFCDSEGRTIGGEGNMPQALLDSTAEVARQWQADQFQEGVTGVKRERIGTSEVEYFGPAGSSKNYAFAIQMLSELGVRKSSRVRVDRG